MKKFRFKKAPLRFDQYGVERKQKVIFSLREFSEQEKKNFVIALVLFVFLLAIFVFSFVIAAQPPKLLTIEPSVARPGDYIFIQGNDLKSDRFLDKIEFAGKIITGSQIKEWTPKQIVLKVPESTNSGLIYVTTQLGKSNGLLFTNENHIPTLANPEDSVNLAPKITNLTQISGNPGDLIILEGERFGSLMLDSSIVFASAESSPSKTFDLKSYDPLLIELWSDQKIEFRLPDIKHEGTFFLQIGELSSEPISSSINFVGGERSYLTKRIHFSYDMAYTSLLPEVDGGKVLFKFRNPAENYFQQILSTQNIGKSRSVSNKNEVQITFNVSDTQGESLLEQYVYDIQFDEENLLFEYASLKSEYDQSSHLFQYYIETGTIPSEHEPIIKEIADSLGRRQATAFLKARANYQYIINRLAPTSDYSGTIVEAIHAYKGNPLHYATLFVALCRKSRIPSRQVAGYIPIGENYIPHYWAQFYIDGFGWIDVDPWSADLPLQEGSTQTRESLFDQNLGCSEEPRIILFIDKYIDFSHLPLLEPEWKKKKGAQFQSLTSLLPVAFAHYSAYVLAKEDSYSITCEITSKPVIQ